MTSREIARLVAVGAAGAHRGGSSPLALGRAVHPASRSPRARRRGAPRSRSRSSRSPTPAARVVGDWVVVDAAGGCSSASSASSALASVLVSPAYLGTVRAARSSAGAAAADVLRRRSTPSGRSCSPSRSPGTSARAWLLVEATTAASALLVGFSGKARALEAGWKYLILTSLGLGVALLGIVLLAAGVPGGGLERALVARAARRYAAAAGHRARRLPAAARRPRGEDRLGAGPQLASRRALRGAAAGLGAALRRAPAGGAARRLALGAGARAGRRRAHGAERADRRSGSSRSPSPCRSSGGRWPGSGCSPTRASSTWA